MQNSNNFNLKLYFTKYERSIKKHWNILQINNKFKEAFPEPHIMSFHRNKKLKLSLDENNS